MQNDVLESGRFAQAVSLPDRVSGLASLEGKHRVVVHGIVRIHGQDHEVTFPAKVKVQDSRVTAAVEFVMPFVTWGMKSPSTFVLRVSDKVKLELNFAGMFLKKFTRWE
jgi:YceI-like domain